MKRMSCLLIWFMTGCNYSLLPSNTSNMATIAYECNTHWGEHYRLYRMIDGDVWRINSEGHDFTFDGARSRPCSPCYCGDNGSELCIKGAAGDKQLRAYWDGADATCWSE